MAITFYCGSGSPQAWRVWLALEHKKLPYELKMLSFSTGDLKKEEFLKLNPRGKVPVIVDDDFVLYESVAIVEYLDERHPQAGHGPLFPGGLHQRGLIRRIVQEADHCLVPAMGPMLGELFHKAEGERNEEVIAEGRKVLVNEFARFERETRGDFLLGPLCAADFTVYPLLALALRGDLKKPNLDLRSAIGPKLTSWMRKIEALPYFEKTVPPHWKSS